jgi:hypothetical protein
MNDMSIARKLSGVAATNGAATVEPTGRSRANLYDRARVLARPAYQCQMNEQIDDNDPNALKGVKEQPPSKTIKCCKK